MKLKYGKNKKRIIITLLKIILKLNLFLLKNHI